MDSSGKITGIVLSPELWKRILSLLEEQEDRALVRAMQQQLAAHPADSGALRWQDVEQDWA